MRKGFTLLELLIAQAILLVAIVGILAALFSFFLLNASSRNLTIATNDAQYVLEEIFDTPFSQMTAKNWEVWAQAEGLNALPSERITVEFPSPTRPQEVRVLVSWQERNRPMSTFLVASRAP